MNLPPFRASIKDGYAMNSIGGAGIKNVIGYVAAGDPVRNCFDWFSDSNSRILLICVQIDLGHCLRQ